MDSAVLGYVVTYYLAALALLALLGLVAARAGRVLPRTAPEPTAPPPVIEAPPATEARPYQSATEELKILRAGLAQLSNQQATLTAEIADRGYPETEDEAEILKSYRSLSRRLKSRITVLREVAKREQPPSEGG